MPWDEGLLTEQRNSAGYVGSHACLLAGPGTGKTLTLTKRVCFLIEEMNVDPDEICVLTFTRAAAYELRQRVQSELGNERVPRISTLHSFALRQLLRNSTRLSSLPHPLRIADDWEERNIILEDLKVMLSLNRIDEAERLLNELSADWQQLTADEENWDQRFPNPAFLGAWREHREIYGYVLRAELVYQLKRSLEQYDNFTFDRPPRYLLVDEYQDLNRCDLAVVKAISDRGAEVYVAGDDDQSIYGFRMAHPQGIRRFTQDYPGARELTLEICKRCDQKILDLGLFVAKQDYTRIEKPLRADIGRDGGQIALLRFSDQYQEAQGVAQICRHLIRNHGLQPDQILILLRTDRNGVFSTLLRQELQSQGVPIAIGSTDINPFNDDVGRLVLAFLRLLGNQNDHLTWRTLLNVRNNHVGPRTVAAVYQLAKARNVRFAEALQIICEDPSVISRRYGGPIKADVEAITATLQDLLSILPSEEQGKEDTDLVETIRTVINRIVQDEGQRQALRHQIELTIKAFEPTSIDDLVRAIEVSKEDIEQEIDEGKVNILTMHKAKGLTAEAVIIVAAEDEYIPGRAVGDEIGDERRLLYVSLTRAKHYLFITFCNQRTGPQRHTGRTSGEARRSLTRFLQDAPISPQPGQVYLKNLEENWS